LDVNFVAVTGYSTATGQNNTWHFSNPTVLYSFAFLSTMLRSTALLLITI